MRVLVTGGAGFIGSHVVSALREAGHEPVVFDTEAGRRDPVGGGGAVESVPGDVRDADAVAGALVGVDAVCHQAATVGLSSRFDDATRYVSNNDLGTAVLLERMAAAGVGALALAGSMVVYGEGRYVCPVHGPVRPGPRTVRDLDAGRFEPPCPHCGAPLEPGLVAEDAPVDPRNVYAATKLMQEHLAASWARATGGRAISLRYHNVYGAGMPRDTPYAGVASFFRSSLERGEPPQVYEDGAQRRDFVHVTDVAAANVAALEALALRGEGPAGELRAYNTGSGEPHTILDMATALAGAFGGPSPEVTGGYRLGDVRHITASSERLRAELGWRARVGFGAGMEGFARAPLRETGPEVGTAAGTGPGDR
ncbi:NAD-dependent epimerase/dehydratase family protein [Streptomyces sp. Z26]|uniref:NAD-dependent epimerase/dehydratase family protein n=1 Tax=Streptomyces TaxID=1883 RepID=UPI000EF13A7D|nr:NAD-dependent epimerase/dehydratase family protein [Streptomyces sp. Z26]RLL69870.1 NAD-dependent epimerase/dehydratase family protein [Streptomyces sp. Z26]